MQKTPNRMGRTINACRRLENLTAEDMAEFLKISLEEYESYEIGEKIPNSEMLSRIARLVNCTVGYLKNEPPKF